MLQASVMPSTYAFLSGLFGLQFEAASCTASNQTFTSLVTATTTHFYGLLQAVTRNTVSPNRLQL